ncbi:MAG: DUF4178 domain-containing protein [Ferruginibacter sp.]
MLQCPSCSSILNFTSEQTNVTECSCGKVIAIKDGSPVDTRITAATHSIEFIVQGTKGVWQGKPFKVTGRLLTRGEDWLFNYWNIVFNDGEKAYLAESYGSYAILKNINTKSPLYSNKIDMLVVNNFVELQENESFCLLRKNNDVELQVEAEVFLPGYSKKITVLDFYSEKGNYITVFEFAKENICYYETLFTEFAELKLTALKANTRHKTYSCLQCYKNMDVFAFPFSLTVSCANCGTHHIVNQETGNLEKKEKNNTDPQPDIQIGCTGTINNISFKVIGYSQKMEYSQGQSKWKEYVLYNREHGFAFLSEFEGHWIYVKEQARPPVLGKYKEQAFGYDNKFFELFNAYTYTVVNAVGEHPYDISKVSNYNVREFIAPPVVWFTETNKKEANWFIGNHIESSSVLKNFTFPDHKPSKYGVGMVQPTGSMNKQSFFRILLISMALLLGIHILTGMNKTEKVVLENQCDFKSTSDSINFTSTKFHLDKWKSNLRFEISAPVNNNWFELNASLINADNGKEYSFQKGVEHYSGYSDGESWSEGSTDEDAYLTGIPAGNYFLNFTGRREPSLGHVDHFNLKVVYDVSSHRNLLFAILIVVIFATAQYFIFYSYNKRRWQNSRFSPYSYES